LVDADMTSKKYREVDLSSPREARFTEPEDMIAELKWAVESGALRGPSVSSDVNPHTQQHRLGRRDSAFSIQATEIGWEQRKR
jgi:hypothetical protein